MSSQEATWERLDSEFDHYLVDMKPYVLKLAHKSERQRCALWVKKLCDPSGAGTGVMGRKNRNMYAKLLLHMLRRGVLEGPFTHRPEQGSLKTLPTYMSIYFDEPSMARELDYSAESLPDWVTGELGSGDSRSKDSWRTSSKVDHASLSFLQATNRQRCTYNGRATSRSRSASPARGKSDEQNAFSQKRAVTSSDESDFEARLNSWNLGIENPRYLREKPISLSPITTRTSLGKISALREEQSLARMHEKEIEMKSKMVEAKFHEEKLKLQQKHDTDVQKILERKNNEIEELKALCRSKQKEAEEMNKNLERRVQSLVRESQRIRESKEQQIAELKKMAEQSADCLKNDWEKKLHNIVADLEQEKFELQKKHTGNIQELLEDTNSRLGKMEAEYSAQTKATNQMVKELETRVQQLTVEAESNMLVRQKLMQDKGELEQRCHRLSSELQDVKSRYGALQKDKQHVLQEHEQTRRQLQSKRDSEVNYLKQEQARSAAKAAEVIEDLEQNVIQFKKEIQESEYQKHQELRNQAGKSEQEKLQLEQLHGKQIQALRNESDKEQAEASKQIRKLEDALREKEDELARVSEMQKLQALQADTALEEFKRQVELNSDKVYSEMKQQMEKVEVDLSRSKCVREKQSKEFSRQLEEHKQRSEQQIVELKLEREQEKTYLFQQHSAEKDSLVREHEREIDNLEKQLRAAIVEHENQTRQLRKQDTQTISELEAQVHQLREELIQVNSQRKQQLVELGLLREEEKQKALREHEAGVSKLRAEMERMKLEMQRASTTELEQAAEKTSSRLKQIDKEYSQRLLKSSQTIAELQAAISTLREENSRQQLAAERQHQEAVGRFEDEKRLLIRDNDRVIKNLENEIENGGNQRHALEKKLQHRELEVQEQIVHIQQEYQLKMKGLMPAIVRQELEDTIASLKSQVNFLQKRASILQEEVTSYRNRR
ncbi:centrosomal protein of 112 kDa isoform X2 [Callorhinchus milii]|uniref:centrosomal protein of 112 kDa isoform X2 n=1 Tax=Callorhinchus milii TaxID=7868 RepID=UPI001C3F9DB8|nr:centrosomal protein of 112 kDa isoform X2 [Callorhinchus milii]